MQFSCIVFLAVRTEGSEIMTMVEGIGIDIDVGTVTGVFYITIERIHSCARGIKKERQRYFSFFNHSLTHSLTNSFLSFLQSHRSLLFSRKVRTYAWPSGRLTSSLPTYLTYPILSYIPIPLTNLTIPSILHQVTLTLTLTLTLNLNLTLKFSQKELSRSTSSKTL